MKKVLTLILCAVIFFSCTKPKEDKPAPTDKQPATLVKVEAVDNYGRVLDAITVKAQAQ